MSYDVSHILARLKDGLPSRLWLESHLDHADREACLIWPFTRAQNGYPTMGAMNRLRPHRIMCERRHGPPPTPKHQAAHSCNRGHEGCINQWHLDWKTPSENQLDRFRGQPVKKREKLTPEQVSEIRVMKGRERTVDLAARSGVTEANIRQIQAGQIWRPESSRHIFSNEEIQRIRAIPRLGGFQTALAKEFGVSHATINRIRSGTGHRYIPLVSSQHDTETKGDGR